MTDVAADGSSRSPRPARTRARAALRMPCSPAARARTCAVSRSRRFWNETAVARASRGRRRAAGPGARSLRPVEGDAECFAYSKGADREAAISYAAYRLLVWRASFGANLEQTFALLDARLRSLCYSPDFTRPTGASPAALGNRIAAAAIADGRNDGSLEALHYFDASYVPQNAPLVLSQAGSTVHDPTFWQPLALGQIAAHGLGAIPAKIQSFVGAQWGHVRGFAFPPRRKASRSIPGRRRSATRRRASYKQAAVAVIRATAAPDRRGRRRSSPLAWNVHRRLARRAVGAAAETSSSTSR